MLLENMVDFDSIWQYCLKKKSHIYSKCCIQRFSVFTEYKMDFQWNIIFIYLATSIEVFWRSKHSSDTG